jgi:hypothetical protein
VHHHQDDPLGGIARLRGDGGGHVLADLVGGQQHEDPPLREQRRAEALREIGGGELGGPDATHLGSRVGRAHLGDDLVDGPLDQQFFLSEHEAQRRGRGGR